MISKFIRGFIYVGVAAFVLNAQSGFAQHAAPPAFATYAQKIATHPQAQQLLEEAEQLRFSAKGKLGLPDPVIALGFNNLPIETTSFRQDRMTSKTLGISQSIPNPLFLKALSEKEYTRATKQTLLAHYTQQKLVALLIEVFAQYNKNNEQTAFITQQLAHYKSLEQHFQGQLEGGQGVYWRFSEIDVARALAEQRLNDLIAEKTALEAQFMRLIGEVPPSTVVLPALHLKSLADIESTYPLRLADVGVQVASYGVTAAKADILPDFGLEAAYMQREKVGNMTTPDLFSVKAKVSIPLWYAFNQKPKLQAAHAEKRAAQQRLDDAHNQWEETLKTLTAQITATEANIRILQDKKQALADVTAATRRLYEAGRSGLDMMLNAEISTLDIARALAEKQAQHTILLARYNSHFIEGLNQ